MTENMVTLSVTIPADQLELHQALIDICGFKDHSELYTQAHVLLSWAVQASAKGYFVSQYSKEAHQVITQIGIPFLEEIREHVAHRGGEHILSRLLRDT